MPAPEPRTAPEGELKTQPRRQLERARAAGTERLTNTLVGYSEHIIIRPENSWRRGRRTGHIEVEVRHIADVEYVEHFTNETKVNPFLEPERLCHADILRSEVIAKLVIRRKRDRGIPLSCGVQCPGDSRVVPAHYTRQIALGGDAAVFAPHQHQERGITAGRRVEIASVAETTDRLSYRRTAQEPREQGELESHGQIDRS